MSPPQLRVQEWWNFLHRLRKPRIGIDWIAKDVRLGVTAGIEE
jgi:hypothetical protein